MKSKLTFLLLLGQVASASAARMLSECRSVGAAVLRGNKHTAESAMLPRASGARDGVKLSQLVPDGRALAMWNQHGQRPPSLVHLACPPTHYSSQQRGLLVCGQYLGSLGLTRPAGAAAAALPGAASPRPQSP